MDLNERLEALMVKGSSFKIEDSGKAVIMEKEVYSAGDENGTDVKVHSWDDAARHSWLEEEFDQFRLVLHFHYK